MKTRQDKYITTLELIKEYHDRYNKELGIAKKEFRSTYKDFKFPTGTVQSVGNKYDMDISMYRFAGFSFTDKGDMTAYLAAHQIVYLARKCNDAVGIIKILEIISKLQGSRKRAEAFRQIIKNDPLLRKIITEQNKFRKQLAV